MYVADLRELERQYGESGQSDIVRHAFHELRFGTNLAPEANKSEVEEVLAGVRDRIERLRRNRLHQPIDRDIGMRGVVGAFGELRFSLGNPAWIEYAKWYTTALNRLYADRWLDIRARAPRRQFLLHVAEDHNETIVNYRLDDARAALGAYVQLLAMAYGQPIPEEWNDDGRALKEELLERLFSRIVRGFKKQVRPKLRPEFPDGGKPLTDAVSHEAEQLAGKQIRRFERELDKIEVKQHHI